MSEKNTEIKDCIKETKKHIKLVRLFMVRMSNHICNAATDHDQSKLSSEELDVFAKYTPKLKDSTYGSDEYKQFLKEMKPALDHHYSDPKNRHHPEHFKNGIKDMNLVDIIELLCDWRAASERHANGNIIKSININQERFGYSDELKQILLNTIKCLENS